MITKLSNHHLVCVLWDDAHMSLDEFEAGELPDFHKAEQVKSFGLKVRDDEKGITLASDEGMTDGRVRKVIFIPRGMIVEVTDLGLPRKPATRRVKQKTLTLGKSVELKEPPPLKIG